MIRESRQQTKSEENWGELFDLREDEKRDEIRKLEKQISALESKLNERRESKKTDCRWKTQRINRTAKPP